MLLIKFIYYKKVLAHITEGFGSTGFGALLCCGIAKLLGGAIVFGCDGQSVFLEGMGRKG